MKKINIIIIGLAAVVFTGCKSLYGKYERPDVDTEGLFRDPVSLRDTLVSNDTTSFGNLPWREVFTDPHLQTIIEKALTNNIDLLNAALNVKMVEEQLKVAKLAFLPSVAVSPQGTISSFDGKAPTKAYTLPVSASWNVDLFGNLLNSKRSVQMQLLATKDYQTVVQVNIISGVANLYYTLLMLDRQLEIMYDMT
ncbi:MAG: TolC family protein, partial [Prevotella sp.]|nr:TolC family protein [Prevotella sp.]